MPTQEIEPSEDEHRDAIRYDVGNQMSSVTTLIVAMPTRDPELSQEEPTDATPHSAGKPMPVQDSESSEELRDAIRYDVGNSTPTVDEVTYDSE
jgi:hypothetical protein